MSFLRLFGKLSLDGSGFEKTLAKADNQGKQFSNRMEGYFRGLGRTILGTFTGAALLSGIKKLADESDRILNLVDELQISAKLAQEVGQAFQRGGLPKEAANESLRGLLRQIRSAKGGSQASIDALATLGVQGALLRPDLNVEEALTEIIANFRRQGGRATQEQREAVQQVFLSRATPALLELSKGRFSTISNENLSALDQLGDTITSAGQGIGVSSGNLIGGFLRSLTNIGFQGTGAPGARAIEDAVYRGTARAQKEVNDRP